MRCVRLRRLISIILITIILASTLYMLAFRSSPGSHDTGVDAITSSTPGNASSTIYYEVRGSQIYMINMSSGEERPIHLYGVNWFGFETPDHVVHGLWARNWEDMLLQIKSLGFNAIRLPFCTDSVQPGTMPSTIDYSKNPDLQGLTSLEIMEKIINKSAELGIFILLDYHRIGCQYIEPLWYNDTFTEQDYIDVWVSVAERFGKYWNVIGADLKNEPHSSSPPPGAYYDGAGATWGMGNNATDWNLAAERIGRAILEVAPHWLIFVEGTQYTNPETDGSYEWGYNTWWGGNLMAVRDYPVNLPREKLVYSPHVYGPDVYNQPYFNEPDFPDNMPDIWYHHFGYVKTELGYPVVIGEFGGRYGHGGDPRDVDWQNKLVDWMIENGFCDFFYWSWNPNSGDTGGILKDDWTSIWEDKYQNLKRLMDHCSQQASYNGTIAAYYLQDLDPEKIKWHHWTVLVLEPDEADETIMDAAGNWSDTVLAYLNIGYAEDWRSYWQDIAGEPWVHEETGYEGEYYIEYWNSQWHNITRSLAAQYLSQGFDGVYLDNIDAAEVLDEMSPSWASGVDTYAEMISLVCNISSHVKSIDPSAKVYINIGGAYNLLYNDTLLDCIDGVLREELWTVWEGYNQTAPQDPDETSNALNALSNAHSMGIEIIVADPVRNGDEASSLCSNAWSNGFIPVPQPAWAPDYEIPPLASWCSEEQASPPGGAFNLYVDFENDDVGQYTEEELESDFGDINWSRLDDRAYIAEEDGNKYLRVEYPAGEAGSRNSGASFVVNLPESDYCVLEYMVRFEDGFDFSKGGKLPGLSSGGSYWTGFRVPENGEGWSARFMWRGDRTPEWDRDYNRSDAALFLYLYWMHQENSYGDYISLNYTVVPGVWYKITQVIYVGTAGEADAYITVYINDTLALNFSNIQLRGEGQEAYIDSFYFSTFFGGSSSSWAPNHTVYADFDNINITCTPVASSTPPESPGGGSNESITFDLVEIIPTSSSYEGVSTCVSCDGGQCCSSVWGCPNLWGVVNIGNATMDPNVWGWQDLYQSEPGSIGYGNTTMHIQDGIVHVDSVWLINTTPLYNVMAYHEVIYGAKPWGNQPVNAPNFILPMRVEDLPRILVGTRYTQYNGTPGNNYAFEAWIFTDSNNNRAPGSGDYEIMVQLYIEGGYPAGYEDGPVAVFEVPIIVDGEVVNQTFELYDVVADPGWRFLTFKSTTNYVNASIVFDYTYFIELANQYLGGALNGLYLMSLEFGTEVYTNECGAYPCQVNVTWTLDEYYYALAPRSTSVWDAIQAWADNLGGSGSPPTVSITANTTSISPGDAVAIQWSITGADGWVSNIPGAGIPGVDYLILSPLVDPSNVSRGVGEVLGYISITTIGGWEPWASNVTEDLIIGYTSWGDAVVNASDPRWWSIVLDEAIPYILGKGFTGVFFDNLDQVDAYPEITDGVIGLIQEVRDRYPNLTVIVNRGFTIIEDIAPYIDGVLFEAYGSYYDYSTGEYRPYTGGDLEWINATLQELQNLSEVYGIKVLGLAYGDPATDSWDNITSTVCSLNRPYGNPVYIATAYLDTIGVVNPCGGEEGSFIVYYGPLEDVMAGEGTAVVSPVETTTYYIYAWNTNGTVNRTITITVSGGPPGGGGGGDYITIRYPDEEWPTAEIDLDNDGVNDYIIEINPWNIDSADGYAEMTYYLGNRTLYYVQELDNIVLRNPGSWVHGYPEIFYGNKPWNQYNATDGPVPLPASLSSLNNFYVTISYSLDPEPGLPVNLAIESWLTRDQWRSIGVHTDEQELMIWLYYDGLQPAGSKIGEIIVPIIVNGTEVNATFEVWKAFIGWEYIAFRITTPIKAGTVTLPYAPFISTAFNITDLSSYEDLYLEDVEVGTEFGSPSTTSARMKWWIYAFNLTYTSDPIITVPPPPPGGGSGGEGGASSGNLTVTLVNSWGSGAQYDVSITLDEPDNWNLLVKIYDGEISDVWGARENGTENGYIVLVAEEWNRGPEANVGFVTSGDNPLVEEVLLVVDGVVLDNWTAPEPDESALQVDLVIDSDWNSGFVAKIYITNNGNTTIPGWYIKILMTSNITSIWGAEWSYLGNNTILLTPVGYTRTIDPGETVEIGFVAEKHGDHPYPEIIEYGVDESSSTVTYALPVAASMLLAIAYVKRSSRKLTSI
ncbi:MAG: cellulase family glycosylhydrolase [Desulfurococcales archaeon]|nr:cellulase family glycosylhydrolase [Desulfurococcales archaeon]